MGNDFKEFAVRLPLPDQAATEKLGARIAAGLAPGDIVALEGDLGAGKTTLARAILRGLAITGPIPSPTFTLVQHYEARVPVSHYDLYRVEDPAEIDELGLDAALDEGCAVIEWPERAMGFLPEETLWIALHETGPQSREASVHGPARWKTVFSENDTNAQ